MSDELAEKRQRISAYAVIVNNGEILLARIANGYPGAGAWTLPGGGLDWGEHPEEGMHRELYEETGLSGTVVSLLGIDSLRLERVRNGSRVGFHAIRVIYLVDAAGVPSVVEVDGSVAESRWIALDDLAEIRTVELVTRALEMLASTG